MAFGAIAEHEQQQQLHPAEPPEATPLQKFRTTAKQAASLGGLEDGNASTESILHQRRQDEEHQKFRDAVSHADTFHDKLAAAKQYAAQGFHRVATDEERRHGKPLRVKKRVEDQHWIEVLDTKHRYGSNLKHYHGAWARSATRQSFFYWLDQGEGKDLSLPECSREKLENECIIYLKADERRHYLIVIGEDGKFRWSDPHSTWAKQDPHPLLNTASGQFVDTCGQGILPIALATEAEAAAGQDAARSSASSIEVPRDGAASTGDSQSDASSSASSSSLASDVAARQAYPPRRRGKPPKDSFIYCSDVHFNLYCGIKHKGRMQHTSFLAGGPITSAGTLKVTDGVVTSFSPMSGHYRTTADSFEHFIQELKARGADLSEVKISKTKFTLWFVQKANTYHSLKKKVRGKSKGLEYRAKEKLAAGSDGQQRAKQQ